jgi:hypothetical protein
VRALDLSAKERPQNPDKRKRAASAALQAFINTGSDQKMGNATRYFKTEWWLQKFWDLREVN